MPVRNATMRQLSALLLLLLALAGCEAVKAQNAYMSGLYEENQAIYEGMEARGEKLTPIQVAMLCEAYSNLRSYSKVFGCADRFETELKNWNWGPLMLGDGSAINEATVAMWRAQALLETGRGREAVELVDKALVVQGKPGGFGGFSTSNYAKLLGLRGLAYASVKDFEGARRTIKDLHEMTCGFVNLVPCNGERNLALALVNVSLGDFRAAAETSESTGGALWKFQAAFSLGTTTFDRQLLPREFLRVKLLHETGKTSEAKAGYLGLLANPATRSSGEIWWNVNFDLGRIARTEGDADLAAKRFAEAVRTIESQRANINTEAAKIGFIGDKQAVYGELVSLLVKQGRAGEALEYVERAKSRALVDLLAERQRFAAQDGGEDQAESLKLLASLEQKSISMSGRDEERGKLRSALSDLTRDLRQKAPELASLVTVSAPSAADIQARLAPDETLLEYYGQGDALYAFSVTREAVRAVKLDARGLEADVRRMREAVAKVGGEEYRPIAKALYERLIAPVPGALDRPRLVIVGHGPLHYLPWGALVDGQQGGLQFLLDRVALTLLPSASVMQFIAARPAATAKSLLLLGNPDLGDKNLDLPGAEAEARAIKGLWPDSTMLMRKAATRSALTKAGGLFKVIHVAAHGEFASDQPLASRLLLAPEGADDGRLTAGDLYGMRLNADLVTLSACETGLGKVLSGDDVVGLTRGFLYAGASSIVASLWPVSDDETTFLMASFYRNLKSMPKSDSPKADALRAAQLETKKRYPHPFYWSAFQLTGLGR